MAKKIYAYVGNWSFEPHPAKGKGISIFDYEPACRGAEAYIKLAVEFLTRRGANIDDYRDFKLAGDTPLNYDFGG